VKRHTRTADTQLTIVDDDRVGRSSRSYEDDSRTDGKNNEADTGAERRSIRDRHHSNDEECDNDPPHAGDHSLSVRLRHAVIFPAPGWTGSTVACHDRRVGFRLAAAVGERMTARVLIQRLDPDLPPPRRGNPGDAGWDLFARHDVHLAPGERQMIPTGVAIALPPGFVGLVHPRSGLASRHGFTLVNSPGTIDAGYRGEICVIGVNTDPTIDVRLQRGDRVAQLIVQRVHEVEWHEVDELPGSHRGDGGFGSSGR